MTARPATPAELLWTHQLKREHGQLLSRVQHLEEAHEARLRSLEGALTQNIQLQNRRIHDLEEQLVSQSAAGEHISKKLDELEQKLQPQQYQIDRILQQLDQIQNEKIPAKLQNLAQRVSSRASSAERQQRSIQVLEKSMAELQNVNKSFQRELGKLSLAALEHAELIRQSNEKSKALGNELSRRIQLTCDHGQQTNTATQGPQERSGHEPQEHRNQSAREKRGIKRRRFDNEASEPQKRLIKEIAWTETFTDTPVRPQRQPSRPGPLTRARQAHRQAQVASQTAPVRRPGRRTIPQPPGNPLIDPKTNQKIS